MADIQVSIFRTSAVRSGTQPSNPAEVEGVTFPPVNPLIGSHPPVTIVTPANGLSIVPSSQVLSIGLASSGVTGALSGTDWSTFNGKLNLTSPITGYTVGANTELAATDTILQAFGKVQGQINARISGTIASGQVAFGTGVNTVGGNTVFVRSANGRIGVGVTNPDLYSFNTNTAGWLVVGDPTAFGGISIASSNTSQGYLAFADGSSGGDRYVGEIRYDHADNQMYFRTNGTSAGFIDSNGRWLIGPTVTPTNTLDVNGTARIRTISNLGLSATNVLVPDATGVVSLRTASQFLADAGGISGTIASGQVAFGTGVNTVGGDSGLTWDNVNKRLILSASTGTANFTISRTVYGNNNSENFFRIKIEDVGGVANDVGIGQTESGNMSFNFGPTSTLIWFAGTNGERLRLIGSNGNLLIGTTTDSGDKLRVNGTVRIDSVTNAVGNVMTISATGVLQQRTISEIATDGGFVTLTDTQTITGAKTFNADTVFGDVALDYVGWDNTSKTFGIFSQVQYIHKYRGGAAGALNMGQYDVNGNASINNTSNAKLLFGTNNTTRLEIEADGDIIIPSVPTGTGDVLMYESGGRIVKGSTGGAVSASVTSGISFVPQTDAFTSVTYSNLSCRIRKIDRIFYIKLTIATSQLTKGTASGNLDIVISNTTITDIINSSASQSIGVTSFRYTSTDGFATVPTRVNYVGPYKFYILKNSGSDPNNFALESRFQVSDLLDYDGAGFKNYITIDAVIEIL